MVCLVTWIPWFGVLRKSKGDFKSLLSFKSLRFQVAALSSRCAFKSLRFQVADAAAAGAVVERGVE